MGAASGKARISTLAIAIVSSTALAVTGLGAGALAASGHRNSGASSLVGAWRAHVTFTTGPLKGIPFQFLLTYAAGGGMVESSNLDENPPVPPAYGAWRSAGTRRLKSKYIFWTTKVADPTDLTQGWTFAGSGVLEEHITLSRDGNAYTSAITYQLYDTRDMPLVGQAGTGRVHATRITVR
jgi:hypothetical protein